jgi:hypothetical protein
MRRIFATLIGLLLLTGCSGLAPLASASMSSTATTAVHIRLADGKADPSGERVEAKKGNTLVLTIDSDRDDEIHVHGYDIEIPVTAGKTVTKEIVLDQIGRFEVESHEPALTILQLIVS